jgi:hypothetical protein
MTYDIVETGLAIRRRAAFAFSQQNCAKTKRPVFSSEGKTSLTPPKTNERCGLKKAFRGHARKRRRSKTLS